MGNNGKSSNKNFDFNDNITQTDAKQKFSSSLTTAEIDNLLAETKDSEDLFGDYQEDEITPIIKKDEIEKHNKKHNILENHNYSLRSQMSEFNELFDNPNFQMKKLKVAINKRDFVIPRKKNTPKMPKTQKDKDAPISSKTVTKNVDPLKQNNKKSSNTTKTQNKTNKLPKTKKKEVPTKIENLKTEDSIRRIRNRRKSIASDKVTNKFFKFDSDSSNQNKAKSNTPVRQKTLSLTKTKQPKNRTSVYDFNSSQSSPSGSDDPAKDIIKNMIKAGKAEIAKYKNGTLTLKRIRNRKKPKPKNVPITNKLIAGKEITLKVGDGDHLETKSNIDNDESNDDAISVHSETNSTYSNTYSKLARHAINNRVVKSPYSQLMSNPKQIKDKKVLLALAKSFVRRTNELQNKKCESLNSKKTLSVTEQQKDNSAIIPWRGEDTLPTVFQFSTTSENLPSFSSDVINPPSPKNNTPIKQLPLIDKNSPLNDSNIENVQPLKMKKSHLIQETNPRKGRQYRSPLKPINIVEVINLPRITLSSSTPYHKTAFPNPFSPEKRSTNQKILFNDSSIGNVENRENESDVEITHLFGFDEYVNEDTQSTQKNDTSKNMKFSRKSLRKSLRKLEKLVPKDKKTRRTDELPKPTRLNVNKIKSIFQEAVEPFRQKNIKEMLTSTLQENEMTEFTSNKNTDPKTARKASKNNQLYVNEGNDIMEIFEDEPVSLQNITRTYERPKRKRKSRHKHNFLMFHNSDTDEHDDDEDDQPKKKSKHHQHMHNNKGKELESFYNEFNSMCAEVENYNLLVE